MTIVVGYAPNQRGKGALHLAAMLARSSAQRLVVCTVLSAYWAPGRARTDAEARAYLDDLAARALARARADLPADAKAEFVTYHARSASSGLLEVAEQNQATILVLGSSATGMLGYVTPGSTASWLLHRSSVPVALATRGFRSGEGERVDRVTVAYDGTQRAGHLVRATRLVVSSTDAAVRLAAFAVQPPPPENAMFRAEADSVLAEWSGNILAAAGRAFAASGDPGPDGHRLEVAVGYGSNWGEALGDIAWERSGEVLVVGSSHDGPISRVFLGSRAGKIIKHAPVPVVVVPRSATSQSGAS